MILEKMILEIIILIAQIATLIFLGWTTLETARIRKLSQDSIKYQSRPVLSFIPTSPAYVFKNVSNNLALNIFCFSKRSGFYYITENSSHVVSILSSGQDTANMYQTNGYDSEKLITRKELIKKFNWIEALLNKLEEENITKLIVCYEDVFKNKLYTFINSTGGPYDNAGEVGYVGDLK